MKKLCIALCAVLGAAFLFGGCSHKSEKGVVSEELIEISKNAQYLPSRELLVTDRRAVKGIETSTVMSGDISPETLLKGGLSPTDYDALIDRISPIDTPFNRNLTVSDAKNEVIKVLSQGVLFDEWFAYEEGELCGYGKYYVTDKDGVLTIMRLSSFQPWIYDSASGRFLDNDDIASGIPNYPIRSDNYFKISIYIDNGKEVVECEVAENLSYYDQVTPIAYQYMRNVKDRSFTKMQITLRDNISTPQADGSWGYDIDTDLPYGYIRNFIQLDYSSPDDIRWLEAGQRLPYAFDLTKETNICYGCRSAAGGFSYVNSSCYNVGKFSYQPNSDYKSVRFDNVVELFSTAKLNDNFWKYDKRYRRENGEDHYDNSVGFLTADEQTAFNTQITSVLGSLKSLAKNTVVTSSQTSFDCAAEHVLFEKKFDDYLDTAAKVAIDGSKLAKDYLNNDIDKLHEKWILPA